MSTLLLPELERECIVRIGNHYGVCGANLCRSFVSLNIPGELDALAATKNFARDAMAATSEDRLVNGLRVVPNGTHKAFTSHERDSQEVPRANRGLMKLIVSQALVPHAQSHSA